MYTSHIGKRFVEIYNRRTANNYSIREFFVDILFPLFFDHPTFLLSPANTPLFQKVIAKRRGNDPLARQEALTEIHDKINSFTSSKALIPDMSFAIGYGSADEMGTTAGQISSFKVPMGEDETYASWIGACLGIGVGGGQNLLIDDEEILWSLFEGWTLYRKYVGQNEGIDNKIETWNGIWLCHRLAMNYDASFPEGGGFNPLTIGKEEKVEMKRPSWVKIVFSLARVLGERSITMYVYQFSQMNTTIGFVQCLLPQINRVSEIYDKLFAESGILKRNLSDMYETQYGLMRVCESGAIGLRQLEPKNLRKYMPSGNGSSLAPKFNDDESKITFYIYQSWIIAMLEKPEFLKLATDVAKALQGYVSRDRKTNKTRSNEVDKLLEQRSREKFIDNLRSMVEQDESLSSLIDKTVNHIHLDIPSDNFAYFITLIRFKYALPANILINS